MKITHIDALEVLDSRGYPTVEAIITVEGGYGSAMVPSGASTGTREALELRDGGKRFAGKGVLTALANIESIKSALIGKSFDQKSFDTLLLELDGTPNKSKLGANAILALSMAFAKASANAQKKELFEYLGTGNTLPIPFMNIINGGAHADNSIDVQEFMVAPIGAATFADGLRMGVEVYHSLKAGLKKDGLHTSVGDEGGFAPNLPTSYAAMEYISKAVEQCGLVMGKDIALALDIASSELYQNGLYVLEGKTHTRQGWIDTLQQWCSSFPIISIEDAMAEDDWGGWAALTKALGKTVQLVGDDVFVTQKAYLERGIKEHSANAILIKLNQVGTVTETLETIALAQKSGFGVMVSHRSGETEDTFIADLAVATNAGQIKTGAPCRSERNAKYNRLLRIAHAKGFGYAAWDRVKAR